MKVSPENYRHRHNGQVIVREIEPESIFVNSPEVNLTGAKGLAIQQQYPYLELELRKYVGCWCISKLTVSVGGFVSCGGSLLSF